MHCKRNEVPYQLYFKMHKNMLCSAFKNTLGRAYFDSQMLKKFKGGQRQLV